MANILSTKTLSESALERLLAAGHKVTHYDILEA